MITHNRKLRTLIALFACFAVLLNVLFIPGTSLGKSPSLHTQNSPTDVFPIIESFRNSTAPGWLFFDNAQLTGNGVIDPDGQGWLRLTSTATTYERGSAVYNTAFPSADGIVADFQYADYGGTGADGFTFYLIDGATNNPTTGAYGGSLGYSPQPPVPQNGVTNGYVGIAFDEFGNFTNVGYGDCNPSCPGRKPNSVALRGSGNGLIGYNYLTHTQLNSLTPPQLIDGVTRANARSVRIFIINEVITVQINFGSGYKTVIDKYNLATALEQATIPATFKMGFSGSTGANTNYHEIRTVSITKPVNVTISDTPSSATIPSHQPITFTVTVTNDNTSDTSNATLSVPVPANLSSVSWSCTASAGSSCGAASGSGAINQIVSLLKSGVLTYQITGIAGSAGAVIDHTASISLDPAFTNLGNNTASASVPITPAADLSIQKSYQRTYVANITFTITATNLGPDSANGAVVSDTLATNIHNATWTCTGTNGATCTPSGTGSIMDTLSTFPSGGTVTYTIIAELKNWSVIFNQAEITAPAGVTDPVLDNNLAKVQHYEYYFPLIYKKAFNAIP